MASPADENYIVQGLSAPTTVRRENLEGAVTTELPEPAGADETDDGGDNDSALDAASLSSETTSLSSSVTKYREENGRRYHAYGSTEHWGPNDEQAQEQQDLSHHLWCLTLRGKLYLAPIEKPQSILDLGTGTGIWAMDMADEHPQAEVKGIDLSPIQPPWVPPNLKFEIDDYNLDWLDVEKFDLIHSRELLGTVPSWPDLYKKVFSALKPTGWFDQAEPGLFFTSSYDTLGDDHVYHQWGKLMVEAGQKSGMNFDIGPHLKGWLEDAGFINVTEIRVPWPIGNWAKDPHQQEIGVFNKIRLEQGILDFCSRRFSNNMGWKPEELEIFGIKMRTALKTRKLLAHQWAYFVYAQKPPST
ncbi:S-adenosyl-L-methionine-dependent methyltransferase [Talaromyces proteolyticus]|uniref:S-adenosyl-L-methionine-dependent methyltransferase n=1 Tax=Talaromyces proteolyticus TaxID=1131652 RepID=A0AAD4KPF8_9EURO|nr:S-adenosyl-L-methionine-dependent methyltransferase [Talaromyces proteolyticus]KAH8696286.1 S-adenosyl-L-methionine-dependent methyltransferase [Talaromyces proteolyticus]